MNDLGGILRSAFPLAAVELGSLGLAFITLPLLIRVLGPAAFGQYVLGVAAALTLVAVIDYGFNQLGPKDVARAVDNASARAAVFWPIQRARALLAAVAIPVAALLAWMLNLHLDYGPVLLAAALAALSALAFPQWFLQGAQYNRTLAGSVAMGRAITAGATLAFVRQPSDAVLAVALQALTGLWAGLFALREPGYRASVRCWKEQGAGPLHYLKRAWPLFMACAAVTLYTSAVPLLLGVFSTTAVVAQFGLADRIRGAVQTLLVPVGIVAFPRFSVWLRDDPVQGLAAARRMLVLQATLGAGAAVLIALLAAPVIRVFAGDAFLDAEPVAQILGLCILFNGISNTLGMQVMLPLGCVRAFAWVFMATAAFALLAISWGCRTGGASGAATALVIAEALAALLMATYLLRRRLLY